MLKFTHYNFTYFFGAKIDIENELFVSHRPKATNVKRSLLMKHRLVFPGGRSSVSIRNMLSASLRANKRGFDMGLLNIKSSNVKFSIEKMPSALSGAIKMGLYGKI